LLGVGVGVTEVGTLLLGVGVGDCDDVVFDTVMYIGFEVVVLPAKSLATAVKV
jgi:hypothetical protein